MACDCRRCASCRELDYWFYGVMIVVGIVALALLVVTGMWRVIVAYAAWSAR